MKKVSGKFWTSLTSVNVVAMVYPYTRLVQADSYDARYFAAVIYFGAVLLLAIVDLVAVKLAG